MVMRIAFLHRRLAGGGTEADLCRMATGLAARGHEVHAFVARADATPPGVHVRRVPVVRGGRVVRLLSFAVAASRAAARERWDVVVGFGRTLRQDVVRVGGGTHRTYLQRMERAGQRSRIRGPYHRAILWLERRQFAPGAHHRIVAVSSRVRDEIVADYAVDPTRITVVYNGVDLERFHPDHRARLGPPMRTTLGIGAGEPLCAVIGSGFVRKGVDLLFALWRDGAPAGAHLLVVGDDERLARWQRQAQDAAFAGRVTVAGRRDDVDAVLAAADVVVVPSRQEAFGNVVLEACAAGVPVVASRRVGAAELLDGDLATLVIDDPEDGAMLRGAIVRALGADHARFACAARAQAERLPWGTHVDRIEAVLREVADGR